MTTEYEHEGVIYHETLPRIVLTNFSSQTNDGLRSKGHNSVLCEGNPGPEIFLTFPKPANEVDILILRDSNFAQNAGVLSPTQRFFNHHVKVKSIGVAFPIAKYYAEIIARGGICTFMVGAPQCALFGQGNFTAAIKPGIVLYPNQSAFKYVRATNCIELTDFVERRKNTASVMVGFADPVSSDFLPLIQDSSGVTLAFAMRFPIATNRAGFLLALPDYGDSLEILHELLSQVLPSLAPHLFPFRHDLSWLMEEEFLSTRVAELEREKARVQAEAKKQLVELEVQIAGLKEQEQFLVDLLTSDGDTLKSAVKKVLELLIASAKMEVSILDVDADPALRGGATQKREDLRIELGEKSILLNVSGREQYFRPTSLNQVSSHHRLFLKTTGRLSATVHSLLVANHNYGQGLDPRERGEIFGSGAADAKERLQSEGHGAIGTYDLYRLFRLMERKEVTLTSTNITDLLTTLGIFDYESFAVKLTLPFSSKAEKDSRNH